MYLLVAIDYFLRTVRAEVIKNKRTESVVRVLNKWVKSWNKIEELITDNEKEFYSNC